MIGRILLVVALVLGIGVLTWLPSYGRVSTDDGRTRVSVWSWNIAAEALHAVTDDFEAQEPDINVEVERNGTMLQSRLLLSLVAGKGGPDVAQLQEREALRFSSTARLMPLTAWAAKYKEDFPPSFWQSTLYNGEIYAVPWDIGPCAVYYKRWIFERYNIDVDAIQTWDDFIRVGEQLVKASGGKSSMLPLSGAESLDLFQILMQQNGGGVFDEQGRVILHHPRNVEALKVLGKLLASPATKPGSSSGPQFLAGLATDDVACYVSAAWLSAFIKDSAPQQTFGKWGVFRLPAFSPGGLRNSNLGGSVLVIPESAIEPEAAGEFIQYALCTVDGQIEQFEKFGLFPAYLPAHAAPYFQEPDSFYGGQKVNALFAQDFEKVQPMTRTLSWADAERLIGQSLNAYGQQRPDEAQFLRDLAQTIADQTGREVAEVPAS